MVLFQQKKQNKNYCFDGNGNRMRRREKG